MVAPNFKKATDTNPGDSTIYGAPDIKYAFDVLDGTDTTDRIQAAVIEGRQQTYNCIIKFEGSDIVARNATGAVLYSGPNATTGLQTGINQGGHIYIGPGTYNTTATLLLPSNTHVEADMNTVVRGRPTPNSHPVITNANMSTPSSPGTNNSYIIIEGGTWDGNSGDDSITGYNVANIHLEGVAFGWVNRTRSLNSVSEGIKVRTGDRAWITNNYVYRSKLESDGTGKSGTHATASQSEAIQAYNIIDDAGGQAMGSNLNCDRVLIVNNICRYRSQGRSYILLEGLSTDGKHIRDAVIANNAVSSKYQCIHLTSCNGVVIANNSLTNVGVPDVVGQGGGFADGIKMNGECFNIVVRGNYIHNVYHHGISIGTGMRNLMVANNTITNVGTAASNTYDGITFETTREFSNIKLSDNLIVDDRVNHRMRHGIHFSLNGNNMVNPWVHGNQIYGELGDKITLWTGNGRFTGEARFLNNSGFNSQGKITNPFNNSHNQIGLPKASTQQYTYAAAPSASTFYTVVMSPISVTSTGGEGVSITVEEPGGNNMITGASTLNSVYMPIGWRISWGAFSSAPTVNVVGL
jgi:hypothetical protein